VASSRETKRDLPESATAVDVFNRSRAALAGTASKPVVRTVMTLTASDDCTVAIALPA
jgi:hypothetical protein